MAEAEVQELRDNLSRYLERVKAGEEFVITDRGRAVARLVPVAEPRPFDRLVADEAIEPAPAQRRRRPPRRTRLKGPVSDLVAEQRR